MIKVKKFSGFLLRLTIISFFFIAFIIALNRPENYQDTRIVNLSLIKCENLAVGNSVVCASLLPISEKVGLKTFITKSYETAYVFVGENQLFIFGNNRVNNKWYLFEEKVTKNSLQTIESFTAFYFKKNEEENLKLLLWKEGEVSYQEKTLLLLLLGENKKMVALAHLYLIMFFAIYVLLELIILERNKKDLGIEDVRRSTIKNYYLKTKR